ncbi:centrosomal protein 97kDa [Rhodnius prolixus]|uniref:centrosomal protein 97kDa n=1 Tax=Rhodnius prolixus TaxID=13249 RepID=UPI003D18C535
MELVDESKLDLSGQCLKKIPKIPNAESASKVTELHLDNNDINRLENISQFPSVVELSATHNALIRMYPIVHLRHVVRLDLSHNQLVNIEGLKELVHLTHLNLSCNKIKAIEQLRTNTLLEQLDLSENAITAISNISQLAKLRKLFLHRNLINQLRHCEVYLPITLETLTLAGNKISDLTEISHLVSLVNLREISIVSNPCVEMTGSAVGFDYRPFLVNWCTGLKVIDGFGVDDIESLKGEWLYSQGRGRQFRPGQHTQLVKYLIETCPLNNQSLQSEHERKLRVILSKAYHHQSQLRMTDQLTTPGSSSARNPLSELMTRSLDPALLDSCKTSMMEKKAQSAQDESLSRSLHGEMSSTPLREYPAARVCEVKNAASGIIAPTTSASVPLDTATKLVPVPESLISPMVTCTPPLVASHSATPQADTEVSPSKLETIRCRAEQRTRAARSRKPHNKKEQAAICIQKMWRGYCTRNLNPRVLSLHQHLQTQRTYQYIQKLSQDMEATKAVLDNEHKLQLLQMQAINALWKKVVSLQPSKWDESIGEVKDLAQTCDRLNSQVKRLQSCMQEVLRCVSPTCQTLVTSTQTDIVAVHTPQTEVANTIEDGEVVCRLVHTQSRPSSLALGPAQQAAPQQQQVPQLSSYADSLVDGVIKDTVPMSVPEES